jgi:hypothetical protein
LARALIVFNHPMPKAQDDFKFFIADGVKST